MKPSKDLLLAITCIVVSAYFIYAFAQVDGLSLLDLGVALLIGWVLTPMFFIIGYWVMRDFIRDIKKIWRNDEKMSW